jgi:hypothetical protein
MSMATIFIYTLGRLRGAILGWGIGLALFGGYMIRFFDTLAEQGEALTQLMAQYPQELLVFFGDMSQMFTPAGYLHIEFFSYMPLILGIFIASMAGGLLAGDEEKGTLDLVLSHPDQPQQAVCRAGRCVHHGSPWLFCLSSGWPSLLPSKAPCWRISPALEMALPLLSLAGLLVFLAALDCS